MDYNTNNNNNYNGAPSIPPEYTPISMWGYFGYELLFAIPCVGFILLIIFSFAASNVNLRNFARSYFCIFIILLIAAAIVFSVLFATGVLNSGILNF